MRVIAYYLPQFHEIKENNEWWGKGFTEWTNVGRAKPLFKGHYQPRVPADLGYYNLCMPEIREAQAEMAKNAGIEGFAYWHYWFAGKRLLERPFNEVLRSKKPDFPFCLAWANETWTGVWNNDHKKILIRQTYPGERDYVDHFHENLPAFFDSRYIQIDGRNVFVIYKPFNLPDPRRFIESWNDLAIRNGMREFFFIGVSTKPSSESTKILKMGFSAVNTFRLIDAQMAISRIGRLCKGISRRYFSGKLVLSKYNYVDVINHWIYPEDYDENVIPTLLPNWDNSPRSGEGAIILHNSCPRYFEQHVIEMKKVVSEKKNQMLFLKSWNEWAEGNYMEPDLVFGTQYINILRKHILDPNC